MTKSDLARAMDDVQRLLHTDFRMAGFRKHGRSYNRITADGLTQVIGFQMGSSDPPGTTYFPGLRENLYGLFSVNLGVYVPEVARYHGGSAPNSVVRDYHCCIRTRLGSAEGKQVWWQIAVDEDSIAELSQRLENDAFPFFRQFESRNQILDRFLKEADNTEIMAVPRIVCAIIVLQRGERELARNLLAAQARDHSRTPGHPAYVVSLARKLGIEISH